MKATKKPRPKPSTFIGFKLDASDYIAIGISAAKRSSSRSQLAKEVTIKFLAAERGEA